MKSICHAALLISILLAFSNNAFPSTRRLASPELSSFDTRPTRAKHYRNEHRLEKRWNTKVQDEPKTDPQAVLAFVFGICSIIGSFFFIGLIFSVFGFLLSITALSKIKDEPQKRKGRGLAVAALLLSILGALMGVGLIIFIAASV